MKHATEHWRIVAVALTATAILAACGGGSHRNVAPTIDKIADQSIDQDTPTAALAVNIADPQTPADLLQVTLTTSNPAVVSLGGLALSGTGASRSLIVTPTSGATGMATVSLNVINGNGAQTITSFVVTVNAVVAQFSTLANSLYAQDGNADPKRVDNITFTFDANDNESAFDALFQ